MEIHRKRTAMPPGRAVPQAVHRLPGLTRMKTQTKQLINKKNINKKFPGNHKDFSGAKVRIKNESIPQLTETN